MNINIHTSGLTLTDAINDYVEKRMGNVQKFLMDDSSAKFDLELAKTSNHHRQGDIFKAEIHITKKGENIYATVEKEDLYAAIDEVKDEVLRKLKSSKDKQKSMMKKGGAKIKKIMKGI